MYFFRRFTAYSLDQTLGFLAGLPFLVGFALSVAYLGNTTVGFLVTTGSLLGWVGGNLAMWWLNSVKGTVATGQSWGKRKVGLVVETFDGTPLTKRAVIIRETVKALVLSAFFPLHAILFVTKGRQGIHDMTVETFVREA